MTRQCQRLYCAIMRSITCGIVTCEIVFGWAFSAVSVQQTWYQQIRDYLSTFPAAETQWFWPSRMEDDAVAVDIKHEWAETWDQWKRCSIGSSNDLRWTLMWDGWKFWGLWLQTWIAITVHLVAPDTIAQDVSCTSESLSTLSLIKCRFGTDALSN